MWSAATGAVTQREGAFDSMFGAVLIGGEGVRPAGVVAQRGESLPAFVTQDAELADVQDHELAMTAGVALGEFVRGGQTPAGFEPAPMPPAQP